MTISPSATYTTRSGLPVRIYAVDGGGAYPVHGAVLVDGAWRPGNWSPLGEADIGSETPLDLLPAPREWKRWVVIPYENEINNYMYKELARAQEDAAEYKPTARIIEITIREPRED